MRCSSSSAFNEENCRICSGQYAAHTGNLLGDYSVPKQELSNFWLSQEDKRDMLHAVYRVGDMDTTIEYYKKHFGMKLLRYRDIPDVRANLPVLAQSTFKSKLCSLCCYRKDPPADSTSASEPTQSGAP